MKGKLTPISAVIDAAEFFYAKKEGDASFLFCIGIYHRFWLCCRGRGTGTGLPPPAGNGLIGSLVNLLDNLTGKGLVATLQIAQLLAYLLGKQGQLVMLDT